MGSWINWQRCEKIKAQALRWSSIAVIYDINSLLQFWFSVHIKITVIHFDILSINFDRVVFFYKDFARVTFRILIFYRKNIFCRFTQDSNHYFDILSSSTVLIFFMENFRGRSILYHILLVVWNKIEFI